VYQRLAAFRIRPWGVDRAVLEGLREMIAAGGARRLAVGDLRAGNLAGLAGSGNPAHLRNVDAACGQLGRRGGVL